MNEEYEGDLTPEEEKAAQEAELHRYDSVDPFFEVQELLACVDNAKDYLEHATGHLIEVAGCADACQHKAMQEACDLLRAALGHAVIAINAIQPNGYLAKIIKDVQEERDRVEDAADARSW